MHTCTQNVAECFLEAQVNLKLSDVMYICIHMFGKQKCLPLYKFYNKPIFNYTYQNNNKILAIALTCLNYGDHLCKYKHNI